MFVPSTGDPYREVDLPARIRALRMPGWAGVALGAGLLVVPMAAVAGSIFINESDGTIIPFWVEALILAGAVISSFLGTALFWRAGEWVTLTPDAAVLTRAFVVHVRVERAQLEDFHAYLHQYPASGGPQYRMVPTLTTRDWYDRLRDVPIPFLSYWNPVGGTEASLPPHAGYIEAWARAGSNPYSRAMHLHAIPGNVSTHRQAVRTGLQRRSRIWAIAVPVASVSLGLSLGFGLGPVAKVLGHNTSFDTQTNRTGVRDLDDALTPGVTAYQWRAKVYPATGTREFTFFPIVKSLPSAPYTVRYFIRDPAQHGTELSGPEQKYGRIVSQGTISVKDPTIEFTLDNNDSTFTFEVYVTDDQGHTTLNSELYRDIAALPASTSTS
ncbi:hypothetical protein [Pseudarthrobacter sp. YAF2]|uniref:hypothetical protein n=1 Tax=Pseudarthrobacter sp. YAF2 TaxID=3233078 RepID=UPI003F95BB88